LKNNPNDFDAQIADATITLIQHILLTFKYRIANYESKTGLFAEIKKETTRQRLNQRLWGLFIEIMQIVQLVFNEVDEEQLMERIFESDLAYECFTRLLDESCGGKSAA
jgi:predicted RNase H-like nuclease